MTTQAQDTSVRAQVVVDAGIERAFSVFTEDFGSFKPREHNLLAVEIAETVFGRAVAATSPTRAWAGASAAGRAPPAGRQHRVILQLVIGHGARDDLERTSEVEDRGCPGAGTDAFDSNTPCSSSATARLGRRARRRRQCTRLAALPAEVRRRRQGLRTAPRGRPRRHGGRPPRAQRCPTAIAPSTTPRPLRLLIEWRLVAVERIRNTTPRGRRYARPVSRRAERGKEAL